MLLCFFGRKSAENFWKTLRLYFLHKLFFSLNFIDKKDTSPVMLPSFFFWPIFHYKMIFPRTFFPFQTVQEFCGGRRESFQVWLTLCTNSTRFVYRIRWNVEKTGRTFAFITFWGISTDSLWITRWCLCCTFIYHWKCRIQIIILCLLFLFFVLNFKKHFFSLW